VSDLTWADYRATCGYEKLEEDPQNAFRAFEFHHFGRYVGWEGYVVRVNLRDDDPMSL
jgi:hypothetical protein